tara:strand:+ start:557 stop:1507 length:951 start_codon:yes stop_codon:yes gene_type:complete
VEELLIMLNKNKAQSKFLEEGFYDFGSVLDKKKCSELQKFIDKNRPCNKNIFYTSKKEFLKKGKFKNYSPGTIDHNAIYNLKINLDFIEKSPNFIKAVETIVGKQYLIKKKSIIRSVPKSIHPLWASKITEDIGRPNVNPYIKREYQDVQYFQNIDFHQDMTRGKKFITFYIYLDDVTEKDSPLKVLSGSYKFGASHYPHYIRPGSKKNEWFYSDLKGNHMQCEQIDVFGKAGKIFCFHGLNLHGTALNLSKTPRVSLRYLIQSDNNNRIKSCLGKSFKLIKGNIVENRKLKNGINFQRLDRASDGKFLKTGTSIL